MKHPLHPAPLSALLAALAMSAPATAQLLYSRSIAHPSARMTLSLKLHRAQPNTTFGVATATSTPFLSFVGPTSVASDGRGYAAFQIDVLGIGTPPQPLKFQVKVTDVSLPNGALTRDYLVRIKNGQLYSAWPNFVMSQGAFCNPADSASSHLQIDRAADLDGDGIYGDVNIERNGDGRDPLDSPSEFSCDVNATGIKATNPSPPGLYLPGGAGRTVAFCTDNRIVSTTTACTFTTQLNFIEDMAFHASFNGKPAVFATSSSNDNVLICRDLDGDGSITANEIKVLFDPVATVNSENYSADGIAIDPTNQKRLWWISDKSGATGPVANQGLFRLEDNNGDDGIASGEWLASWTGSTPVVVVEGKNVDASEFECLHVDSKGAVMVNHVDLGTILRWVDANQNGVAETGEVTNWLTYNMASTLTKSVDFQLPNFPILAGPYFGMNLIESAPRAGTGDVYFVALTNSTGAGAGFVFRCEDRNNDGDVNDTAEVTVFNDQLMTDPSLNFISGLAVAALDENGNGTIEPQEFFVYGAYPNGPRPSIGYTTLSDLAIWRQRDLNGDGDAFDLGESERVMIHPTGAFNRGLELVPPELDGGFRPTFYQRSYLTTVKPAGCMTPAGDYVEIDLVCDKLEEGTQGTPFGGNAAFTIATRGNGTMPATICGLALSAGIAGGPLRVFNCDFWLQVPFFPDLFPGAVPDANGVARFPVAVPALVRGTLALQAFTLQAGQIVFGETGEINIQ